jgi:hypothetical protein
MGQKNESLIEKYAVVISVVFVDWNFNLKATLPILIGMQIVVH